MVGDILEGIGWRRPLRSFSRMTLLQHVSRVSGNHQSVRNEATITLEGMDTRGGALVGATLHCSQVALLSLAEASRCHILFKQRFAVA